MAQFESLSLKKSTKIFSETTVISYMKLMLLPARIWFYGYHDGLSIDCKMKSVYSVIGKLGGSGTNAEEAAIKGILRSIALWPVVRKLRQRESQRSRVMHFKMSPNFLYSMPVFACSDKILYKEILKYMFAGDIDCDLDGAFRQFGTGVSVAGIDLDKLQFFCKLMKADSSPHKYLGTHTYDWSNAKRCLHNNVSQPRSSSTAIVTFADGAKLAIRIQVFYKLALQLINHAFFAQVLFTVELRHFQTASARQQHFYGYHFPMVAAYTYEEAGETIYGQRLYKNPPRRPIIFALTPDVQISQASLHLQVEPTAPHNSQSVGVLPFLHSFVNTSTVAICVEERYLEQILNIKNGVQQAQVRFQLICTCDSHAILPPSLSLAPPLALYSPPPPLFPSPRSLLPSFSLIPQEIHDDIVKSFDVAECYQRLGWNTDGTKPKTKKKKSTEPKKKGKSEGTIPKKSGKKKAASSKKRPAAASKPAPARAKRPRRSPTPPSSSSSAQNPQPRATANRWQEECISSNAESSSEYEFSGEEGCSSGEEL
jgi:hypothetical protein